MPTSVHAAGSILASLLKTAIEGGGDAEGLLFGSISVSRVERLQDKIAESKTHVTTKTHIQDFVMSRAVGEMYDATGTIRADVIEEMEKRSSLKLLGWFSYRYRSPMVPSLRNTAVHRSMEAYVTGKSIADASDGGSGGGGGGGGGASSEGDAKRPAGDEAAPLVHLLMTSYPDGSRCTRGLDYKVYMSQADGRGMTAVSLSIPNLVTEDTKKYGSLSVASPLDRGILKSVVERAGWTSDGGDGTDAPQVKAAEQMFQASDTELHELIDKVCTVELDLEQSSRLVTALKCAHLRKAMAPAVVSPSPPVEPAVPPTAP